MIPPATMMLIMARAYRQFVEKSLSFMVADYLLAQKEGRPTLAGGAAVRLRFENFAQIAA
jgi:hypothetical protein